jgi:hypothetical protein
MTNKIDFFFSFLFFSFLFICKLHTIGSQTEDLTLEPYSYGGEEVPFELYLARTIEVFFLTEVLSTNLCF